VQDLRRPVNSVHYIKKVLDKLEKLDKLTGWIEFMFFTFPI